MALLQSVLFMVQKHGKHAERLLAVEIDFWSRLARISRKDKIRNSRIREIMQIDKNVLEIIEKKCLSWYGHLKRMTENKMPWKILNIETARILDAWSMQEHKVFP